MEKDRNQYICTSAERDLLEMFTGLGTKSYTCIGLRKLVGDLNADLWISAQLQMCR